MMSRLALLAVSFLLLTAGPAPAASKQPSGEALRTAIRAELDGSEMGRLLMQAFPDDYVTLENRLVAAREAGPLTEAVTDALMDEFLKATVPQIGPWMTKAPAAQLLPVVQDELAVYLVLQTENPRTCMRLGSGQNISPGEMATYSKAARDAAARWRLDELRAVVAARQTPVTRSPYTPDDRDWLRDAYLRNGVEQSWWDAIPGGDFSIFDDATRCRNDIAVARTWINLGGEAYGRYLVARFRNR